jgi:nicotinamidase-related amidase
MTLTKEQHMPVSTFDAKPALVVIDLQKGILAYPTVHPVEDIVQRSASLAKAFREHGLAVVLVNATGGAPGRTQGGTSRPPGWTPPAGWAEIVEELEPQDSDLRVTKKTWGAFHNTDLDAELHRLGVTQVVLTGISTSAGVESTARAAHEHGYHVVLATDAMTDTNADTHQNSIERIFPKLGETATTAEILAIIERRERA